MKYYLIRKFGAEQGTRIYNLQQERLLQILSNTTGKSESQRKTLKKTILPRVALYLVLKDEMPAA